MFWLVNFWCVLMYCMYFAGISYLPDYLQTHHIFNFCVCFTFMFVSVISLLFFMCVCLCVFSVSYLCVCVCVFVLYFCVCSFSVWFIFHHTLPSSCSTTSIYHLQFEFWVCHWAHKFAYSKMASVWLYGFILFISVTSVLVFFLSLVHIIQYMTYCIVCWFIFGSFTFFTFLLVSAAALFCLPIALVFIFVYLCVGCQVYIWFFPPCPMASLPLVLLFVYLFIPSTFSLLPLLPFSSFICLPPALLVCSCFLSLYYRVAVSYASLLSVCLFQISQILILTSTKSLTPLLKYQSDT